MFIPQQVTKEQQGEAMFSLNSSSPESSAELHSFCFFFLKKVRLVATYLRARVIPLVPVLPPHPAPSEPATVGPTLGEDCDWDSHSTEHQAMRKPGQAAN